MSKIKLFQMHVLALLMPICLIAKDKEPVHSEAFRFLCETETELAHDINALKHRLGRIFKKGTNLKISQNAILIEFQTLQPTDRQLDEMMNTGLIEIMAPADPVQDPSVKSAYEFVAQMNSNLKEINKRRTIADYVWEKRNDFTLPADYEIATIIDYSSIHSQPVKEPVEILLLKKKALFNNSDFESIEYFEEKDPEIPERYGLAIKLKKEAARKFEEYTRKNKGSKIFTFIDHEFIAGPIIHEPITSGAFVISRWTRVKEFFKMMARYRKAEFYQCQVVSDR